MPHPPCLVLATTNKDKVREIMAVLTLARVKLLSLDTFPVLPPVAETGNTFVENALLKARAYARAIGLPVLAEDSGLAVDALGGRPGVHSARYAPTDRQRIARVLQELEGLSPDSRSARFVSAMALARPEGPEQVETGILEGRIALGSRGSGGFGYDPIFELADGRTVAELSAQEKNATSHRGRALARIIKVLPAFLEDSSHASRGCLPLKYRAPDLTNSPWRV